MYVMKGATSFIVDEAKIRTFTSQCHDSHSIISSTKKARPIRSHPLGRPRWAGFNIMGRGIRAHNISHATRARVVFENGSSIIYRCTARLNITRRAHDGHGRGVHSQRNWYYFICAKKPPSSLFQPGGSSHRSRLPTLQCCPG